MTPVLSRAQMRAYDAHAISQCGVPGLVLMENAGRGAAEAIGGLTAGRVVIVCGGGNNGGDGFVVARHLMQHGAEVAAVLVGKRPSAGDAAENLTGYLGVGGTLIELGAVAEADCVVDALFGTGLARDVAGDHASAIAAINASHGTVVALDIPSGIDCDTGHVLGCAVRAEHTLTFGHRKIGMLVGAGPAHCGAIEVVRLGLPDDAVLSAVGHVATLIEDDLVRRALGSRAPGAHKYDAGSLLVVAGSPGKTGAAVLAGRAALRAGAGLVTIATWPEATSAIDAKVTEVMTTPLRRAQLEADLSQALLKRAAAAIGPGLGLDEEARQLTERLVLDWRGGPVVLDADAISHFAGRHETLREAPAARIITPHEGELARLLGLPSRQVRDDRLGSATRAARETGCVVVLKGQNTLVCSPAGAVRICTRGNSVLATAGSGDVLTGIVAALACQADPFDAASAGVFVHATAADRWRRAHGDRGMIASDLIDDLPATLASFH